MGEDVAIQFAADTAQAVGAVRELAGSAQALADSAKAAADGVAGLTEPAAAAGDAAKVAAGSYDELAASAKAAGDAQESAAGKSGAAAEGGLGKYHMALVGIGVGAAVAVDGAVKYQAETTRLVTSAGESAANLDKVRNGMLTLSSQTDQSTEQLSSGMYLVESAGFHGANGLTVLKAAAQGAKDEGADLSTVANGVTDALVDYHKPASDAANITSQLIAGVAHGKTTFEEFSGSMSNILPLASSMHLGLADVTGVLAEMTSHGVSAAQASQDEANSMRELMKPNAAMTKEWGLMGINAKEVNDKLGSAGLAGTLQWMSGVARDGASTINQTYNQALGKMVGTAPALQVALMTTGENAGATASAIKAIGSASADSQGNVDGFSTVSQTASFQLGAAKQAAMAMGITLGEVMLPALMDVIRPLTSFLQLIQSNHAASIAFAVVIGGVLAGAIGMKLAGAMKDAAEGVKVMGDGLEWMIGKLTGASAASGAAAAETEALNAAKAESVGATEAAAAAQGELDVAMDANPIGLVILAIVALIAIVVLLVTHWKDVVHWFDEGRHEIAVIFDGLRHDVSSAVDDVAGFFNSIPGRILHAIGDLGSLLVNAGKSLVMGLISGVESMGSYLVSSIESLIPSPIRSIVSSVLGIFSPSTVFHGYGVNLVVGLINGVKSQQGALRDTMTGLTGGVLSAGSAYAAGAIGPAGGTSVHVTVPVTAQGMTPNYSDPQFSQYMQATVQEAVLRYSQLNPTNGLTPAWGR